MADLKANRPHKFIKGIEGPDLLMLHPKKSLSSAALMKQLYVLMTYLVQGIQG